MTDLEKAIQESKERDDLERENLEDYIREVTSATNHVLRERAQFRAMVEVAVKALGLIANNRQECWTGDRVENIWAEEALAEMEKIASGDAGEKK